MDLIKRQINNFYLYNSETIYEKIKFKLRDGSQLSQIDLDYLLLYLENVTKCTIIDYWLDSTCDTLNVNAKKLVSTSAFKNLPLETQIYKSYVRSFDKDFFLVDEKRLIVKNPNKKMDKYMTTFLKNLLSETGNEIALYYESRMFHRTFIVELKNKLMDFNSIYSKNKTSKLLARQNIHLLPAFKTNLFLKRYKRDEGKINDTDLSESNKFEMDGTFRTRDFVYKIDFNSNVVNVDSIECCYNMELINDNIALLEEKTLAHLVGMNKIRKRQLTVGFESVKTFFSLIYCYILFLFFTILWPLKSKLN